MKRSLRVAAVSLLAIFAFAILAACKDNNDDDDADGSVGDACTGPVNVAPLTTTSTKSAQYPCANGLTCLAYDPGLFSARCMQTTTSQRGETCTNLVDGVSDLAAVPMCAPALTCVVSGSPPDGTGFVANKKWSCVLIVNAGSCADETIRCGPGLHCDRETKMCSGPGGEGAVCDRLEDCIADVFFCDASKHCARPKS